jgi:beta-xylosidase
MNKTLNGIVVAVCAAQLAAAADLTSQIDWWGAGGPCKAANRVLADREQVRPLLDQPLRDPSICKGPAGWYYLTGTEAQDGRDFLNNEGIHIWKSKDLQSWEPVGKALDMSLAVMKHPDDSPGGNKGWRRRPMAQPGVADGQLVRGVQAPEIHYLKDTFWIVYSLNGIGGGLLKSTTGQPEGPYEDWAFLGEKEGWGKGSKRLFLRGGSPSLFQDDDGAVYMLYHHGYLAKLKDDLTGLAEPPRLLVCANPDKTGVNTMDYPLQVGRDGYFLKKLKGRYYLFATDFTTRAGESVEDVYVAWSDNIYGPYSERRWCLPHSSQTTVFAGPNGELLATYCGNDVHAAFRDRAGIVPLGWAKNDHPTKFAPQEEFPRKLLRVNTERYPWHRLPVISRYPMRDTFACRGPDGAIYYTGSFVSKNTGGKLFVYRSTDMVHWEELTVWDWDRQKQLFTEPFADPRESKSEQVFSFMDTEIWHLNGTFYIGYSVYGSKPGQYLLKSTTGKAEGPYAPVPGEHWCQPSFFQDADGKIYYGSNNTIVPWKPDMTGPQDAETRYPFWSADGTCNIGDCSGQLLKIGGHYVGFTCGQDGFGQWMGSQSDPGSYIWNYMTAKSLQGPWRREQVIGPHTGHGGLVQDRFGNWWACSFACEGSMAQPCLGISSAYIVPLTVTEKDGTLHIRLADQFPDYVEKALPAGAADAKNSRATTKPAK